MRRPGRRRGWRVRLAAVAAVVGLAACSSADPTPDPGASPSPSSSTPSASGQEPVDLPRVAVVLPSRNTRPAAEIEVQRGLVDEVATQARREGRVDEVRVVVPDRFSTVGDVVEVLAEQGYDLVCALGPGAARGVREVAARFPETRFCATPGRLPEVRSNTLVFDLRVEEAAYLAGIAARFAAPAAPSGLGREPALVFGEPAQVARLRPAFDEGFLDVRVEGSTTAAVVAPDEEAAAAAAATQYEAGAFVVYTSAGRADAGVVAAARDVGGLVVGWHAWLAPLVDEAPSGEATTSDGEAGADEGFGAGAPWNLLLFRENLATALRDAIAELGDGWSGGTRTLGFANGALALVPGTSPAWASVEPQVLATRDAIVRGDLTVGAG